jgi:hypothetical protein
LVQVSTRLIFEAWRRRKRKRKNGDVVIKYLNTNQLGVRVVVFFFLEGGHLHFFSSAIISSSVQCTSLLKVHVIQNIDPTGAGRCVPLLADGELSLQPFTRKAS